MQAPAPCGRFRFVDTAAIVWLSNAATRSPGILPLLPTFAVIALLVVGAKGETAGFREACLAGAKTVPAYPAFLLVPYLVIDRADYRLAVVGGMVGWMAVVLAMFVAPRWI